MRNPKNKLHFFLGILALTTSFSFISCKSTSYKNTSISAKNIIIDNNLEKDLSIEEFVTPYREHIDNDLNKIISFSPEAMDKSKGKWETSIGNLFATAVIEEVNPVFKSRYNKDIDICMLNHGGIRSIISEGNVTTRTAFEVMPFENSAVVVELKGEQILELAEFMINEERAHPLAGIIISIDKNKKISSIKIKNEEIDLNQTYFVVTNDYLSLGGDNMKFFTKGVNKYIMDYKLRNVLLAYFEKNNPLPIITTKNIIEE
nr:5'-nucleotidase [uncultured Flavobacterium sp.]